MRQALYRNPIDPSNIGPKKYVHTRIIHHQHLQKISINTSARRLRGLRIPVLPPTCPTDRRTKRAWWGLTGATTSRDPTAPVDEDRRQDQRLKGSERALTAVVSEPLGRCRTTAEDPQSGPGILLRDPKQNQRRTLPPTHGVVVPSPWCRASRLEFQRWMFLSC